MARPLDRGKDVLRKAYVPWANVVVASNPLLSYFVAGALADAGLERRGEIVRLVMTMRGGDRPKGAHNEFSDVSVMPRSMWEPWLVFRKPLEGRVQSSRRWVATSSWSRNSCTVRYFTADSTRPFFFGSRTEQGLDLESVALGAFGVGTLHLGVVVAGAGDGALGIVDGQALWHAVEPLERTAVTSEPGGDLLVGDDLGVGVARPRRRHDEDPGAEQLPGARVEDLRPLAEVDLRGLAGVELKDRGHLRVSGLEACEEAAHRGVRAGEAVAADQGAGEGTGEKWWSETSDQPCRSGSIKANIGWRL